MNLRPYQIDVYEKIISSIKDGNKRILVLAATGFGKTILAKYIAKNAIEKGNRVLFTNHRIALASQSYRVFSDLNAELLQGENKLKDPSAKFIVASLQTLIDTEIPEPKIIIIDECHYGYEGNLIQSLFSKFPDAYFIGLSATPVDNNDNLIEGFDSIISDYQTKDLIDIGMLTPFKCFAPLAINISKVKATEFDEKEQMNVIEKENINKSVVDNYLEFGENRTFICFGVNKKHLVDLKKVFQDQNISVEIIDADTNDKERVKHFENLKNGNLKGLLSIEILTAGFDEPKVACVILAMATMQWKKYIQCAGRGIRLIGNSIDESTKNGKSDCILLDFGGNIERHGLPEERKVFKFGKKISRVIDKKLGLNEIVPKTKISVEKEVYLRKIGSTLDLYDGKKYKLESELQEDVNTFLKRTGFFWWRQNSGKAFIQGRWVHFASKNGLPDNAVFYRNTSFFFGLELKLPNGRLTVEQQKTLPEMLENKVLFFICESVYDVFLAIEHVEKHINLVDNILNINMNVYNLPESFKNKLIKFRLN